MLKRELAGVTGMFYNQGYHHTSPYVAITSQREISWVSLCPRLMDHSLTHCCSGDAHHHMLPFPLNITHLGFFAYAAL